MLLKYSDFDGFLPLIIRARYTKARFTWYERPFFAGIKGDAYLIDATNASNAAYATFKATFRINIHTHPMHMSKPELYASPYKL